MSDEEIRIWGSKRKGGDPVAPAFSSAKAAKHGASASPSTGGVVTLEFPEDFLSREGDSIVSRADIEKLLFPAPHRQLNALSPELVCEDGASFFLLAFNIIR